MFKLIKYANKKILALYTLIVSINILLNILVPYIMGKFVDTISTQNWQLFVQLAILSVSIQIFGQGFFYLEDYLWGLEERSVWNNITSKTLNNLKNYDSTKFEINDSKINQELGQNYELIKFFFGKYPVYLILYAINALVILLIIASLSKQVIFLVVILIPLFVWSTQRYSPKLSELNAKVVNDMKNQRAYISDFSKVSMSERFLSKSAFIPFAKLMASFNKDMVNFVRSKAFFNNFMSYTFLNIMIILTNVLTAYQVFIHQLSIGEFFAIQLYISKLWTPIEYFLDFYQDYVANKSIITSFDDFLCLPVKSYVSVPIPKISLKNYVSFDRNQNLLHKPLNADFYLGKKYLIQGKNGAGKTNLITAILGLHHRYQGEITYPDYGNNLNFAYCQANPVASVYYQDSVSKGASMGQLKLHQINQIMLEKKSVYIFDEPTNFLDTHHKIQVREQIDALANENTMIIIISHDDIMLEIADEIISIR